MPASNQHFKHHSKSIHNPSKLGENSYLIPISYFYFCLSLQEQKWVKYNKLNSVTFFSFLRRLSLQPGTCYCNIKSLLSPEHKNLNAKHALCKGSVFLKKTDVVSVNIGLSKLPPDTPARHSLFQLSAWKLSPATASYLLAAFMILW